MNEFKSYHPIVNFTYFVFSIGFSCFFMHPVCILISLVCSFVCSSLSDKSTITKLKYILPILMLMALINPLFNHKGVTILTYLPSKNPLTLESIIYGFFSSAMIISVIMWFSFYNKIMTSDKLIYLFGRIIPKMSLVISMTLSFVPRFLRQLHIVANAQRALGRDVSHGSIIKRAKYGLTILSITITWALENAIDTADSMKSRGYGLLGRTAFSTFSFDSRDKKAFFIILVLGIYIFTGNIRGSISFLYFPALYTDDFSPYTISIFIAYFLLLICPVLIEILEAKRWKALKSKI